MVDLSERAMLVQVTICKWGAERHDRSASEEVEQKHQMQRGAGRYSKHLIAKHRLSDVNAKAGLIRSTHYFNTLPWRDDGYRILPAMNYQFYMDKMGEVMAGFEQAKADFLRSYPLFMDEAQSALGTLFNAEDYPTVLEVEAKFSADISVMPLPDAGDFRVNLSAEETAWVQQDIQRRVDGAVQEAVRDVWGRCRDAVSRMVERLNAYKVIDGKTEGVFRDTLVTNVRELAEVLPQLNITGDPELDRLANDMRTKLSQYDAQLLRENDTIRNKVASDAEEILNRMAGR